jgi:hypothetical protein
MSQINPILTSIVQTPMAQRQQELGRADQIRLRQDQRKNAAATSDEEVEESVASTDELQGATGDMHGKQQRKGTYSKRRSQEEPEPTDESDSLDLTA